MLAFALIGATAALGTGVASAQSGGATPPPDPNAPPPATAPSGYVFPIGGPHTYGDGFGAARAGHTHMGQDIMAACGTPLVAVSRSTVVFRGFQRAAGNYVVLQDKLSKMSYMYAHLLAPPIVLKNQKVIPGQPVGNVGRTGDATACHLHFELWTRKGWYRGGHAINPLTTLQVWDTTA